MTLEEKLKDYIARNNNPVDDWKRAFVTQARAITGCTHEQAFELLGLIIEIRELAEQRGYARGYNSHHSSSTTGDGAP